METRYKFIGAQQLKIDRLIDDGKRHTYKSHYNMQKTEEEEETVRENGFFSSAALRSQRDTFTDTHRTHSHKRKEEEEDEERKTAHDEH